MAIDYFGTGDTDTLEIVTGSQSGQGSPVETLSYDETTVQRTFKINYDRRFYIAKAILGYPQLTEIPGAPGTYFISRVLPHAHADFTRTDFDSGGNYFVFATKVSMAGWGKITAASPDALTKCPRYEQALATVEYSTPIYDIWSDAAVKAYRGGSYASEHYLDRYVSFQDKPGADYITLPNGFFKQVGGDATVVSTGIGKMLSSVNRQITWHQVPRAAVPYAPFNSSATNKAIGEALGRVNDAEFNGCATGTLLLMAVDIRTIRAPSGARCYDITYMMKYFKYGHNLIYRPQDTTPSWYEVTTDGVTNLVFPQSASKSIYDWYDFTKLFKTATQV